MKAAMIVISSFMMCMASFNLEVQRWPDNLSDSMFVDDSISADQAYDILKTEFPNEGFSYVSEYDVFIDSTKINGRINGSWIKLTKNSSKLTVIFSGLSGATAAIIIEDMLDIICYQFENKGIGNGK
jgi:hypothetical protein